MCRHLQAAVKAVHSGCRHRGRPTTRHRTTSPSPAGKRTGTGACPREPHGRLGAGILRSPTNSTANRVCGAADYDRLRVLAAESGRPLCYSRPVPVVAGYHPGLHRSFRGGGGSRRQDLRAGPQPRVHVDRRVPHPPSVRLAAVVAGAPRAPPAGASVAAPGPRAAGPTGARGRHRSLPHADRSRSPAP